MPYNFVKEDPKFFNPEEELKKLCEKEFEDSLEAMIELATFQQQVNSFGSRGRYPARVEGNRIVAC